MMETMIPPQVGMRLRTMREKNIKRKENKRNVMNMLDNIPHQKLYFYHLPTRGRARIKLGDADTSPTYL